jgi:hypothetical protein
MATTVSVTDSALSLKTGDLITGPNSVCEGINIDTTLGTISIVPGSIAGLDRYYGYYNIRIQDLVGNCNVVLPAISTTGAGVRNSWSAKISCNTTAGNSIILQDAALNTVGIINGGIMGLITANLPLATWDVQYLLKPGNANQLIETSTAGFPRWTDDVIVNGTLTVVGQTFLGNNINAGGLNATFSYDQFNIVGNLQLTTLAGNPGDVIYKTGASTQGWSRITGIRARFSSAVPTDFYQAVVTTATFGTTNYDNTIGSILPLNYPVAGQQFQSANGGVASIYFQATASVPGTASSDVAVGVYINGVLFQLKYWNVRGNTTPNSFSLDAFPILLPNDIITVRYQGITGGGPVNVSQTYLTIILN